MAERLHAAAVVLDVVRGPPLPERLAAHGQLADQVGQRLVVRGAAGLGAQAAHGLAGDAVPVTVESAPTAGPAAPGSAAPGSAAKAASRPG